MSLVLSTFVLLRDTSFGARCISMLLEELVHQSGPMRKGVRQIGNLLGQVVLAIWIGRAWKMGVSICGGSIMDYMYQT